MARTKYKYVSQDAILLLDYTHNADDLLLQYVRRGTFDTKETCKRKARKKYHDRRDWKATNQKLIARGEFYINPRFLDTWIVEIEQMNSGKVGNPYFYPESLIEFLAILHEKGFDVRSLEGIVRGLSKRMGNFPVISYTQIHRRINSLDVRFPDVGDTKVVVGIDGTGNKVGKRGDWIRHVWKVKRGWIKVVVMGTPDGRIIDVRVGNENLDERRSARGMLRQSHKKIKKALMDGLHDCEETFKLLHKLHIEAGIRPRKNASAKGFGPRPDEVRKFQRLGEEEWAKEKGYGLRWPSTEGIFSSIKTIFGECISAKKKSNMYKEAKRKVWAYSKIQAIC